MRSASTSRASKRRAQPARGGAGDASAARVSGRHSACQAPAPRSCSWTIAASSVATSPGACFAQPSAEIAATGLCLCGIEVEPPPRALAHLADLGLGEQDDVAARPCRPRPPRRRARPPARRSGRAACARAAAAVSPAARARRASAACSSRRPASRQPSSPARRACRPAPPSWHARAARCAGGRRPRRAPTIQPAAFRPNVVGMGLLEQRAADHRRVAVRLGEPGRGRGRAAQVAQERAERALGDEHRRGVHGVLARRALCTGASGSRGLERLDHRAGRVADRPPRRRRCSATS